MTKEQNNQPERPHETVILSGVMGSHSVGTNGPDSDTDIMQVVLAPVEHYLGLDLWGQQGTKEHVTETPAGRTELVQYELRKFLKLCAGFNPNVIPLLYLDTWEAQSYHGAELVWKRELFNSKKAVYAFAGYAHGQLKKMQSPEAPTGKLGAKRKALRETHGYDTKYAYHAVRLCRMLQEFILDSLEGRTPIMRVRRTDDRENLMSIRNGQWTLPEVVGHVEDELRWCEKMLGKTKLPAEPDWAGINQLSIEIIREHVRER